MKIRAPSFLKHVVSVLTSLITKPKTASIKNKASAAKTRLFLFSLMHNKRTVFASITSKFHGLVGHLEKDTDDEDEDEDEDEESRMKAVVVHAGVDVDEDDNEDEDQSDGVMPSSSEGVDRLEDEIDRVADAFIRRFHRQMKLQKMESFKRLQEMLQRST